MESAVVFFGAQFSPMFVGDWGSSNNRVSDPTPRDEIQRPSAIAADPFCIWRLHGCRLQSCWLQGFRLQAAGLRAAGLRAARVSLQAAGLQAAGLQAARVALQAAGWTWAVCAKGRKRCTVAFWDKIRYASRAKAFATNET